MHKDRRFAPLTKLYRGDRLDLLSVGTDFQIQRHGEDERFKDSCLRAPAKVLRDRPDDVLAPTQLVRQHLAYRFRIEIGPTYRADLWAALTQEPRLSAAELARRTYASFASAWRALQDFRVLEPS